MTDFTTVSFKGLEKTFEIPATLAEFTIFGNEISIKFYGAIIAFGFALAVLFGGRMAYKWKMSLDKMIDVLIYGTFAAIIGARLYYVFSKWDSYSANPADIIIFGGAAGGGIHRPSSHRPHLQRPDRIGTELQSQLSEPSDAAPYRKNAA